METILLAIGFIALFFIGMSVKIIFKKDGKFEGTCASNSPLLNPEGKACTFCGKDPSLCENRNK
ncbi:membrane or secreted protein [Sediminitomix flava]|uniref:Membrane or secreted protein n=1 Tax=Sediminitomix flava TaxID=379075 RepID=A0A315ZE85_SEDFL|nr:membrane or secreted protein [Sediminitomix flava]PWJ43926.1 hypothetical protein BC781_101276 [Sediminitomix flava]